MADPCAPERTPPAARWGLADWLRWQEGLSPVEINPGLDRVQEVGSRLGVLNPACPVITVAGTNGKGSTTAYLEAILNAAGYRTAVYTSPHLLRYNERIRVAGEAVHDEIITAAFQWVDRAREGVPLTYFEFGTLAALSVFAAADCDVWLLEVGMGGRLDAVNAVDPDLAIITSIGVDHTEWLGNDREQIGAEKAGIMRPGRPVCLGQAKPPLSVRHRARELNAPVVAAGVDFRWRKQPQGWDWVSIEKRINDLPLPALAGDVQIDNAAAAIAGLRQLSGRLPVDRWAITRGLRSARLPGHMERLHVDGVEWLFDVAHNEDSARVLAETLRSEPLAGQVIAVFAAMKRKALPGILDAMHGVIDQWLLPELADEQAQPPNVIARALEQRRGSGSVKVGSLTETLERLRRRARPADRVVVFGSYRTVEAVMRARRLCD